VLLFISYNEPRLSTRSNHTARNANHDHGAVGAGTDATWDREDCGMWSCNGGSVGTQVQGRQGHRDSRQHGSARRTPFRSPQRSSTTSRICFMSEFFFMFSQVLLIPRSGLDRLWFVFCASAPTWFPHTWTPIFKFGVSPACHRFLMF